MAEMHRIDSTGIARSLPGQRKRPSIVDMSIAWSRTSSWSGYLPEPAPPRANRAMIGKSRSPATRSHSNHVQEHAMVMNTRSRVLHKIASHRHKAGQGAANEQSLASQRAMPTRSQHRSVLATDNRVLTPRELEVLRLVAHGETDRGIAERLYLSRRTVSCHVSNILDKLDVESRRKAVLTAIRIGLL